MRIQPEHRSIFVVDIEGFSGPDRTDPIQLELHRYLRSLLDDVFAASAIDPGACAWEDRGDGFLLSISPTVAKNRLLDPVAPLLASRLATYNQSAPSARRLRLRVVVHAGEVLSDPDPNVGQAVVFACRLLDSSQLRACLAATKAPLVAAVSDWIYQEVVRQGYGQLDPDTYRPIAFASKDTTGRAWLHVPGDPDAPVRAGLSPTPSAREAATPMELPADIPSFTGRAQELDALEALLTDGSQRPPSGLIVVSAIAGKGGVGKTALAVHVAHQLRERFPDGQLYVNLGGVERLAPDPGRVLGELLRALGVVGAAIPEATEDRARLYRDRLANRRVLLLLDNAATDAQVRPLLPGTSQSAVLITSRSRLSGLEAAIVDLDVLARQEATELLGKLAGVDRVAMEPEAASQIVRLCGYLPLAVRIAGAKLATRPHWRLTRLAQRLLAERGRLAELRAGDLDVQASFALSYEGLGPLERRAFRFLGVLDGPDFPAWMITTLLEVSAADGEELLERLVEAQLLEASGEDQAGQLRYRLHDLLRIFAQELLEAEEPTQAVRKALEKTLHRYAQIAAHAAELLQPTGKHLDEKLRQLLVDGKAALAWFEAERPTLLAAVRQAAGQDLLEVTAELTAALVLYFPVHARWLDYETTSEILLQAARRARNRGIEAVALDDLGVAYREQRRLDEALSRLRQSLAIFQQLNPCREKAAVFHHLGAVYRDRSELQKSQQMFEQSLQIARDYDDQSVEARALDGLGLVFQLMEDYDQAIICFEKSLTIRRTLGDRYGEAININNLAALHASQGRFDQAIALFETSLAIKKDVGDRYGQGFALLGLGEARLHRGDLKAAKPLLHEAFAVFDELGSPWKQNAQALIERLT